MSPNEERDLVLLAKVYARIAYGNTVHEGIHILEYANDCAKEIAERGGSRDEIIAAYLRDALRLGLDTADDLRSIFGDRAIQLALK